MNIKENIALIYPKIDTLFNRDKTTFKVIEGDFRCPEFSNIKLWSVTEKLDGTNIRVLYRDGRVFYIGSTEKAEMPKELLNLLEGNLSAEKLKVIFRRKFVNIYGKVVGVKIQTGKGYIENPKFILLDVNIGKFWLSNEKIRDIAESLDIESAPYLGMMSTDEIVKKVSVGFPSLIGDKAICEGIIAKTEPMLKNMLDKRVMFKLKYSDFNH